MSHPLQPSLQKVQWYATAPYPCSYLPTQWARSQVAVLDSKSAADSYESLIEKGFRRSGTFVYRPYCDGCQACLPARIAVAQFQPNRTQQRLQKQLQQFDIAVKPLAFEPAHWALYQRYQSARHAHSGEHTMNTEEAYIQFLLRSHVNTVMVEFSHAGSVVAVAIMDVLAQGLSAVYTFFDPDWRGSLGTQAVLWQIAQAQQQGLDYVYLGYLIEQSPKMAYKANFQPLEIYHQQHWQPYSASSAASVIAQK